MDLSKWNAKVTLIAVGAGWLGWPGSPSQCHAQILRTTLPLHLDDRTESPSIIDAGFVDPGLITEVPTNIEPASALANQAVPSQFVPSQFVSTQQVDQSLRVPPPLPEPFSSQTTAKDLRLESDKKSDDANKSDAAKKSEDSKKKDEAASKKKARKNYLPEQKPISEISIDVNSKAKAGSNLRPESVGIAPSELPAVMAATANEMYMGWSATATRTGEAFAYKPLYFEEVNLERYGRTAGLWQPAISTTRFFTTVPLLPYKMAVHSPHRVYYWTWPYPAGTCAPPVQETFPIQRKAALVEAGFWTGAAFLIP